MMASLDSDFENFQSPNSEKNNLRDRINECKDIIEAGELYGSLEFVEDVIHECLENELNDDGLFLTECLIEVAPYNSEYWIRKGLFLKCLLQV